MAERFEMSFKNPELKMWFLIMLPVVIIGLLALLLNDGITSWIQLIVFTAGLVTYYSWRYRYRKKKKKNKEL